MPSCGGSQVLQLSKQPKLRWHAAGQVVAGWDLREGRRSGIVGNGDGRRGRQVRRARFPYAPPASAPSPAPYPATALRRECRGAVAHSSFSAVRSPSCEGKLPLRSLPLRLLREGRRSGIMGERRRMQRAASATRALLPARRHPPCPPTPYAATTWRRGCRGAAAHRYSSAVSSPSCEGTLPVKLLLERSLREGRRSGIMGERRRTQRAASVTRASLVRRCPPCPPTPSPGTAWRRGDAEVRWLTAISAR